LQKKLVDKIANDHGTAYDLEKLKQIAHIMKSMSHCGLGHTASNPVMDLFEKFPDDYQQRLKELEFEPDFDLDAALETARNVTGRDDSWAHLP
jgi:[NiFe] hydrogenase diaphorase moiety large subunit